MCVREGRAEGAVSEQGRECDRSGTAKPFRVGSRAPSEGGEPAWGFTRHRAKPDPPGRHGPEERGVVTAWGIRFSPIGGSETARSGAAQSDAEDRRSRSVVAAR